MDPIALRTARLRLASVIHRYIQIHFANSAVLTSFSIADLRELVTHRPLPGCELRRLAPPPIPADGEWTLEMQIKADLDLAIFNLTYIEIQITYAHDANDMTDINNKIMAMYGEDDAPKESVFHKIAREVFDAFNKDRAERAAREAKKAAEAVKAT